MSRLRRPLEAREVKKALRSFKFELRDQRGSHEQWVSTSAPFRKVTVDCPKAPFGHFLVQSMARQAGVSVDDFYRAATA